MSCCIATIALCCMRFKMVSYQQIVFYSSTVQYFNAEVVYINTLCFDSSMAWKCMRTVDEKQEIF